jgi:DNA-binding transcriptional MocR family regulator
MCWHERRRWGFAEGATERRAAIATSIYRKRVEHAALPTIQELADSEPAIGLAFQPGIPAFDVFPRLVWSGLPKRHDQRIDQSALDYAHYGGGYAPLRQAIAAYLVGSITWRAVHSGSDRGRDLGPRRDSARLGVPIN